MPAVPSTVEKHGDGWALKRGGAPYVIRGAGGVGRLARAAALGANSVRTWSAKGLGEALDEAQKHGLSVCAGFHVKNGVENAAFYTDDAHAADRAEKIKEYLAVVKKYKHHPALLVWAIGNEANAGGGNAFGPLYAFINAAAVAIKKEDPCHVTATVTTSPNEDIATQMNDHCPDVDIWGVNVYGSLLSRLPAKMREVGWRRPWCATEYGPQNWWQVKATDWGAQLEPSDGDKAATYAAAMVGLASDGACVGGYAFKWGWKEQVTVTWVNLYNEYPPSYGAGMSGGEETAAVEALSKGWTGREPGERAPRISSLTLDSQPPSASVRLAPGAVASARADASSPDGAALAYTWLLLPEGGKLGAAAHEGLSWVGGMPQPLPGAVVATDALGRATLTAPAAAGFYRLYVWVSDGRGKMATANFPISVGTGTETEKGAHKQTGHHKHSSTSRSCWGTCMTFLGL